MEIKDLHQLGRRNRIWMSGAGWASTRVGAVVGLVLAVATAAVAAQGELAAQDPRSASSEVGAADEGSSGQLDDSFDPNGARDNGAVVKDMSTAEDEADRDALLATFDPAEPADNDGLANEGDDAALASEGDPDVPGDGNQPEGGAPPNDSCWTATVVPGNVGFYNPPDLDVSGATIGVCEPYPACGGFQAFSVWYSFTPDNDGAIEIGTWGSDFSTVVSVWDGCPGFIGGCSEPDELACGIDIYDPDGLPGLAIEIPVQSGETYLIKVASLDALPNTLDFDLTFVPANDTCTDATVITTNNYDPPLLSIAGAGTETCEAQESCENESHSSVWYEFTPSCHGDLSVNTNGSDFDTVLAIFAGDCNYYPGPDHNCDSYQVEIACDDDSGIGLNSQIVDEHLIGGVTYRIKVAKVGGSLSSASLNFNFVFTPDAPPNDLCSNATVITGASFNPPPLYTGCATTTVCEGAVSCEDGAAGESNSVWYKFTPPSDGTVSVNTNGSTYDTILAIFDDCGTVGSINPLTCNLPEEIVCDDDSGTGADSQLTGVSVEAGVEYTIKVSDYNSASGGGLLDFNFSFTGVEPANDECSSATVIPSGATSFNPPLLYTFFADADSPCEALSIPCGSTNHTVWYAFTPATSGTVNVDTNGSDYDTFLSIGVVLACAVDVDPGPGLNCQPPTVGPWVCDDNSGVGAASQISDFAVQAGLPYRIKVGTVGPGGMLDFNFAFTPDMPPPTIVGANPPMDNPYIPGVQPFRDVLQTGSSATVTQGIGAAGTPAQGTVTYAPILVTFSGPSDPAPTPGNMAVSCSGGPCPTVTSVSGGPLAYQITLSGPIPAGGCISMAFAAAQVGQVLQYQYLPGDVNMSGSVSPADVQALLVAISNGQANQANFPRYNINRGGNVTNTDVLRLIGLLNGVNTTQVWTGATVAPCL